MLLQANDTFWLWQLFGRLHPLFVHFPIGLLCVALLLEILDWKGKSGKLRDGIRILVWIGAGSSVLAVIFGWLLASEGEYSGDSLEIHRWAGIATMVFSIITAFSLRNNLFGIYRSLLFLTVFGVTFAGHYGAMLTHGDDYISSVLPSSQKLLAATTEVDFVASNSGPLNEQQIQDLNVQVRTILAHNCYSCHGEAKSKGDLRLDSKDGIRKAVKTGLSL